MPTRDGQEVKPYDYVAIDALDRVPLRTIISPLPTTFTLIRDSLQNGRRGTPAVWRTAILSEMRRRDVAAFAPLVARSAGWPGLLDGVPAPRKSIDTALDALRETSGTALIDALDNDPDVLPSPEWEAVRRAPDRWLTHYVDALHRGWAGIEPLWRRSTALLERETERLQAATERGVSTSQLVDAVSPRTRLIDGRLRLAPSREAPLSLAVGEQGVTIIPLIASPKAGIIATPGDVLIAVAPALPTVWQAFDAQAPPPASLQALLGYQRTAILQRLDNPRAAGEIADLLSLGASAITFHVRSLEAAGLVARVRSGRNVIVHRTVRGTQLLALYDAP